MKIILAAAALAALGLSACTRPAAESPKSSDVAAAMPDTTAPRSADVNMTAPDAAATGAVPVEGDPAVANTPANQPATQSATDPATSANR